MHDVPKKVRDTSRFTRERRTTQALRAVGPAISNCNARLARCRAVANLSKPGYAQAIVEECQGLRSVVAELRKQLTQIVSTLPGDQHGDSRVRDTRLALDRLETGIDGILETVAANSEPRMDGVDGAGSDALFPKAGKAGDRQRGTAA